MSHRGHICVDLDGTLAQYDKWRGEEHIGAPVPAMLERVKAWRKRGVEVRIFTARASGRDPEELAVAVKAIEAWCLEHVGEVLPVTNQKDYSTVEIWDDRAVQVKKNTGNPVGEPSDEQRRRMFKEFIARREELGSLMQGEWRAFERAIAAVLGGEVKT